MRIGVPLLSEGLRQAGRRILQLSRNRIQLRLTGGRLLTLAEMMAESGDEGRTVCAAIVGIRSQDRRLGLCHLLGVTPQARDLMTAVLAGPAAVQDRAMAASVVQELGNIAASAVANHLADRSGTRFAISPPEVIEDLWGAILGTAIASLDAPGDRMALISTEVCIDQHRCDGWTLLLAEDGCDLTACDPTMTVRGV